MPGFTLDQLQQMGANETPTQGQGMSLQQLQGQAVSNHIYNPLNPNNQLGQIQGDLNQPNTNLSSNALGQLNLQPHQLNFAQRVWNDIQGAGEQINNQINTPAQGFSGMMKQATGAVATAFNTIPKVAMDVLPSKVGNFVNDVTAKPLNAIINSAATHAMHTPFGTIPAADTMLQGFVTSHPNAANTVSNIAETASNLGQTSGDILAADQGVKGLQKATDFGNETLQNIQTARGIRSQDILQQKAIQDATPSYSKNLIDEGTGRVNEGGILQKRTVNPTSSEVRAGQTLSSVKDYPVNGTSLEKYQAVKNEITNEATGLKTSLQKEGILRPPQQLYKLVSDAVNKVPENSLLLQKADPLIKNYLRVTKNAILQTDGTLGGELQLRKLLDQSYENARGKLAFGSDKISALDEIHRAARNALNEDMIAKARSTDVKASLQRQADLYNASDTLLDKAKAEAPNALGRFKQNHPLVSGMTKAAGRAAGIGAGVHIIP